MSFFDSIGKKTKLSAANKLISDARKAEGAKADQMYKSSYQYFSEVIEGDPMRAEALYKWGFALLHQAKTKSGAEAIKIYKEAITRFSFCLMIDPNFLGAAIDGGVACMDLARCKAASLNDELYDMAKSYFEKANGIQAGSASYNLACIYGLLGVKEECLKALEIARSRGSLPDADDILVDPDLKNVIKQPWFQEFMDGIQKKPVPDPVTEVVSEDDNKAAVSSSFEEVASGQPAPVEQEVAEISEAFVELDESEDEEASTEHVAAKPAKIDGSAFAAQHFKQ